MITVKISKQEVIFQEILTIMGIMSKLYPSSIFRDAIYTLYKKIQKGNAMEKKSKGSEKIKKVIKEFSTGRLHSGSKKGPIVKNKKQAIAIGMSEARKAGQKVTAKKK